MSAFLDWIIQLYQKTLSPDHGIFSIRFPYGFCRFIPSCSQYARESIKRHGATKGLILAIKRIFRCNPFAEIRHDPVH